MTYITLATRVAGCSLIRGASAIWGGGDGADWKDSVSPVAAGTNCWRAARNAEIRLDCNQYRCIVQKSAGADDKCRGNPAKSIGKKVGAPDSLVHLAGYIVRDKRVPAGTGFGISVGRKY